ncbi:MAG: 1,4-beta-xylanase [Ferruginibacter sp.]
MKNKFLLLLLVIVNSTLWAQSKKSKAVAQPVAGTVWSIEKANQWYNQHKWITGADFIPSTAINQLEMWQASTFDTATINRELGWAESIGFNTMRVFLHSVVWKNDPEGFKSRINTYLSISDRHHIKTMFVFFDDCWNKVPVAGVQPTPKTGIHNSGWMQDPGQPMSADSTIYPGLEKYVKDILTTFSHDKRILLWDLYNEPGNSDKKESSIPLLVKVFGWAREVDPEQPLSVGLWAWDFEKLNAIQFLNSDIITYHDYEEPVMHQRVIDMLKASGRPLICTEYMARIRNSRFSNIMPLLKKENVGAINWGFVAGKSNTIYAWDTPMEKGDEPIEWFHDIFKKDGTPYREDEVNLIKKLNVGN